MFGSVGVNVRRRRLAGPAAVVAAAVAVGGLCGGASGCGIVHVDCTGVALSAAPVHTAAPYGRLTIPVGVTSGGKPVAGVPVNLWVLESGPNLPAGYSEASGTETTDAAGVARWDRAQGWFGDVLPGDTVTGYYAEFVGGTKKGKTSYCGKKTPVQSFSCGDSAASCGPMPPLQQGIG